MRSIHWFGLICCVLALFLSVTPRARACSEIYFSNADDYRISARNFDFMSGAGCIRFTPAGTAKQTQYTPDGAVPLKWTSRYASITINTSLAKSASAQDGFYSAGVDGINRAGLKIGTYFLESSKFAESGPNTVIDITSLMEYLLDNFKTVDEALADLESGRYRVTSTPTNSLEIVLQLLLHDAGGASAVVEFLNGETVIVRDPEIPVLTNSTYAESLAELKLYDEFGGNRPIPGGVTSLDRFVRGAFYRKHLKTPVDRASAVNCGFALVQAVATPPEFNGLATEWSVVTDITRLRVYFRTLNNPNISVIDLNALSDTGKKTGEVDMLRTDLGGNINDMFNR